jgi:N4-gp56 family major capsid protein
MATSVYPAQGGTVDNTSAATFIPEIWSDEVVAAYKSNLVLAPLVKKMSMTGKKGDTIHIPKPTRGSANAKVANTAVTIQNNVESEVIVSINKHFEFSRMIEDITNVQAHATLRAFYTGDAGYGLAKQIDSDLFDLSKSFGDGDGSAYATSAAYFVDATTGLTEYEVDTVAAADVFSDAGFRAAIQKLDDEDVPMDGRSFVVPPVLRNTLMGIDRYVSSDFVSGGVVANGKIGNLYGTDLYISTNCPTLETAGENSAGGAIRGALMFHKEAMILAEQAAVRSQTQYKQEFLGTLYTADTIYGTKVIRPESGLLIAVNG